MSIKAVANKIARRHHLGIGILVAIHMVILSISGLILLFKDEIQQGIYAKPATHTNQQEFAEKYDQTYQYVLKTYPSTKPLDIYPDDNNPHIIQARLGINGTNKVKGAQIVNFDYQSGQEISIKQQAASGFYNWLLKLHEQLLMGQQGQIYIGLVGIAFLLMNLSGLILFVKKRLKKSRKKIATTRLAKLLKIHQYLGIICLCWGLLVGTTGALLAFNPVFTKNFQKNILQPLAESVRTEQPNIKSNASLKSVINTAFKTKPNGTIWYIIFPGMERGIPEHYLVLIHGNGIVSQYLSEYLLINAKSAELKKIIPLPIPMQLALIATPLHFANYGGLTLKIIWAAFAICTLCFVLLGITIFYERKKRIYVTKI